MSNDLLPTSFLPHLPRQQTSLDPLLPHILLGHIALLRELYIPPIHGGFQASDVGYDDSVQVERRSKKRERRFSASLADTMDNLGLGLDIELDTPPSGLDPAYQIQETIKEEDEDISSGSESNEEEEGEGRGDGHLDPFEREWAEKWLNGVVRRSQGWIEEHEDPEEEEDKATLKDMEAILRDSTAVLAMMAGTSGTFRKYTLVMLIPSCGIVDSPSALPRPRFSCRGDPFIAKVNTPRSNSLTYNDYLPQILGYLSFISQDRLSSVFAFNLNYHRLHCWC